MGNTALSTFKILITKKQINLKNENWYIVQTFSGFEHKVAETLKDVIKKKELEDKITDVLVPIHEVTEVKRGKRVQRI